jgi:hypothetical protein
VLIAGAVAFQRVLAQDVGHCSGPKNACRSAAISAKAKKAKGKQIRDWHLNRRSSEDLSSLANLRHSA